MPVVADAKSSHRNANESLPGFDELAIIEDNQSKMHQSPAQLPHAQPHHLPNKSSNFYINQQPSSHN